MKIPDTLPVKMALFGPILSDRLALRVIPLVACLILFGDNYTSFLRYGPMEFKKSF